MFQRLPAAIKHRYPEQLIDLIGPPYYFRHRNRCLPCQVIELHHHKVRVTYRDERGRPLESWEHARNVVDATASVRQLGQEPSPSLTL